MTFNLSANRTVCKLRLQSPSVLRTHLVPVTSGVECLFWSEKQSAIEGIANVGDGHKV